ncbi:MAG: hypothetical protein KDD56_00290 [Bdellovibrionales bacterium]|nr:hypothetical protein [Bdellovibrionales bacterium]
MAVNQPNESFDKRPEKSAESFADRQSLIQEQKLRIHWERILSKNLDIDTRLHSFSVLGKLLTREQITTDENFSNKALSDLIALVRNENNPDIINSVSLLLDKFSFNFPEVQELGLRLASTLMKKTDCYSSYPAIALHNIVTEYGCDLRAAFKILLGELKKEGSANSFSDLLFTVSQAIQKRKHIENFDLTELKVLCSFLLTKFSKDAVSTLDQDTDKIKDTIRENILEILLRPKIDDEISLQLIHMHGFSIKDSIIIRGFKEPGKELPHIELALLKSIINKSFKSFSDLVVPSIYPEIIVEVERQISDSGLSSNIDVVTALLFFATPNFDFPTRFAAIKALRNTLIEEDLKPILGSFAMLLGFDDHFSLKLRPEILKLLLENKNTDLKVLDPVFRHLSYPGVERDTRLLARCIFLKTSSSFLDRNFTNLFLLSKRYYLDSTKKYITAQPGSSERLITHESLRQAAIIGVRTSLANDSLEHTSEAVSFLKQIVFNPLEHSPECFSLALKSLIELDLLTIADIENLAKINHKHPELRIVDVFADYFFHFNSYFKIEAEVNIINSSFRNRRDRNLLNLVLGSLKRIVSACNSNNQGKIESEKKEFLSVLITTYSKNENSLFRRLLPRLINSAIEELKLNEESSILIADTVNFLSSLVSDSFNHFGNS